MKPTGRYTCTEYRQEMILLGLKRQLEDPVLPDAQRVHVAEKIRELLPNAKLVDLWSESQFFEGPPEYMDALVTSAEGGAGWTLVHPEFTITNPTKRNISVPLTFLIAGNDKEFANFLKQWIGLKRLDGTIADLYEYWILGKGTKVVEPRWSIIRNVLHWVD